MSIHQRTFRSSAVKEHTYLELVRTRRKNGKVREEWLCSLNMLDELRESGNINHFIRCSGKQLQPIYAPAMGVSNLRKRRDLDWLMAFLDSGQR